MNFTNHPSSTGTDAIGWRAVEFFAGVGGFACAAQRAWGDAGPDIVAIDIDHAARAVYELNHAHRFVTAEIQSLTTDSLLGWAADLWWLSPPCQPYSRRGHQRDIDDPRAASLLHLIQQIERVRPSQLALENVLGFADSRAGELLQRTLSKCGYSVISRPLCPTEMGWPNRRPRFYLLASQSPLPAWQPLPRYDCTVAEIINALEFEPGPCEIDRESVTRFESGMDRVDPAQAADIAACFGSSYGKSFLHAGSYVRHQGTWRRFAPVEVASLLGFPREYRLPRQMSNRRLWKLLGNSVSIPAVEYVLRHLQAEM